MGPRRHPGVRSVSAGPPRIRTILGDTDAGCRSPLGVRTCVRCGCSRRSCTPTSTRSSRRSSSATIRRLRGRPVIVGSWVVLAASYEAKACGVRTAMSGAQARRLCPQAVVVDPRFSAYSEASKAVYRVFDDTTPLVEGLSIDEAFLDVRGMERIAGTPAEIAVRLRQEVLRARRPADLGRRRADEVPGQGRERGLEADGLLVVPPGGELAFLHPLPVERLWGVGPRHLGEAPRAAASPPSARSPRCPRTSLIALLGRGSGRHLHALAHNRDPRSVQVGRRRGSIGAQRALGRSPRSPEAIDAALVALVDRVTRRMRAAGRTGRTVVLRLRFGDFTRATRSHTLSRVRPRRPSRSWPPRASCSSAARAADRAAGDHADRRLGREPRSREHRAAGAALRSRRRPRARHRARSGARALRRGRDHPRGAARSGSGRRDAAPAGLRGGVSPRR